MTDRDRDRYDRFHSDRSRDQRDFRPQDSKPYKDRDAQTQDAQPYKQKSQTYHEEWTDRPRDRDYSWARGRGRRSRSPTRFGYHQEAGRLSPTPYEPAYRTDWRTRYRDGDEREDEASTTDMRMDESPNDTMRVRLEAQITALTKEELSFEIDLLIQSGKEKAGLSAHPAQKMMETNAGVSGSDEMDVAHGRLGRYEDMEGTEHMEGSDEEVYGPVLPTAPSQPVLGYDYTNARWPAGQPSQEELALKEIEFGTIVDQIRDADIRSTSTTASITKAEWMEIAAVRTKLQALASDLKYEYQPVAAAVFDDALNLLLFDDSSWI
ncbi:hypothetical protein EG328_005880 [Venturia inaequalis]|uniref:Uncharacterized protein n=1 Tax=Venturia inaequalis TaxID=5025 RepID=A0A8H3VF30_VENIN|nr:hypothetical protein EG328_005880 [Venturia inaequalis]